MDYDELFELAHASHGGFCRHYLTLYAVTVGLEAESVLEFGAGTSSRVILEALPPEGHLLSCDTRTFDRIGNGFHPKWDFYHGPGLDLIDTLTADDAYDLVLHDGSHESEIVQKELRLILPFVKTNGLILLHDTFHMQYGLMDACESALRGWPHEKVSLPYGHGLTVIRNLNDTIKGEIETKWRKR